MRLMCFTSLLMAVMIASVDVFGLGSGEHRDYVIYFLGAAFAPKAVQKWAEKIKP